MVKLGSFVQRRIRRKIKMKRRLWKIMKFNLKGYLMNENIYKYVY